MIESLLRMMNFPKINIEKRINAPRIEEQRGKNRLNTLSMNQRHCQ